MTLVPALLRAIVTVDGDALVLQAGEKPYVASAAGHINLSGGGMSTEAVSDVIGQLLPLESQQILTQFGAVQHELRELKDFPGEQFQVVATNEGTMLGVEIRRQQRASAPPSAGPRPSALTPPTPSVPAVAPPASPPAPSVIADELDMVAHLVGRVVAEGASALYIAAGLSPRVRKGDGLVPLPGASVFSAPQVEALLRRGPDTAVAVDSDTREWFWDFADIGRMRCCSFRDARGPGLLLRCVPTQPVTARQLGLTPEIERLASLREGLVLVASPRGDAARAILGALIDLINHTRAAHVISVEREVSLLYDNDTASISQREAGRSPERVLACARAALREDPDVLAIDTVQAADLMSLALDAAHSGRLVIAAMRGSSAVGVLEEVALLYPQAQRPRALASCARTLSAVVVETTDEQGGQPESRQLLLNTPDVAQLISDARFGELARREARG